MWRTNPCVPESDISVAHQAGMRHRKLSLAHSAVVRHKFLLNLKKWRPDLDLGPPDFFF
jgi:hypothetical protein